MKNLKELCNYAKKEKIIVQDFDFGGDTNWKGHCTYDDKNNCMILLNDTIANETQRKCILAHEIGHFKKSIIQNNILSNKYRDILARSINDFRANKWAINELIPFNTFKSFIGTNKSKFDIANELDVTEELIEFAYYIYEPMLYEDKLI